MITSSKPIPRAHPAVVRLLQEYQRGLDATRLDISRNNVYNLQPIYIVDFQLIYEYIQGIPSDGTLFLEYSFQENIPLILGPGTLVEIVRFLERESQIHIHIETIINKYSLRFDEADSVKFVSVAFELLKEIKDAFLKITEDQRFNDWREQLKGISLREHFSRSTKKLIDLLCRDSIFPPDSLFDRRLAPRDMFNATIFREAKLSFSQISHRALLSRANFSDALNISYIAALRRSIERKQLGEKWNYYPYLLTMTGSLRSRRLESMSWDGFASQLGYSSDPIRFPLEALYSHQAIKDWLPKQPKLLVYLNKLKKKVDNNIEDLRTQHIRHLIKSGGQSEAPSDQQADERNVTNILSFSSEFFTDGIASDILQIRANLESCVSNRELALGLLPSIETVAEDFTEVVKLLIVKYKLHKLFDNTIAAGVVYEKSHLADTAVHIWKASKVDDSSDEVEFRIEVDESELVGVTWPTDSNIATILRYLNDIAYKRHNIKRIRIIVGKIKNGNKPEIRDAIIEGEINVLKLRDNGLLDQNTTWLRLEKSDTEDKEPVFTTYISLVTRYGNVGEIGIITSREHLDQKHLSEFIYATAGDFLLLAPPEFITNKLKIALEV